jgi:hypothetical protein
MTSFHEDEEFDAKSDEELLALAEDSAGLFNQTRALAVLGRRAGENEQALQKVVEVSKSATGEKPFLGVALRWYGVAGLSIAGTDGTRAAALDVMSGWDDEERRLCREFLSLAEVDVPA